MVDSDVVPVGKLLVALSKFASLPYPSESFKDLKVIFPHFLCNQLTKLEQLFLGM